MVGAIVGTVAYMAPEQARGEEVDQRTDIYAFGLILYDLLLGKRRVDDGGAVADLQKRLEHRCRRRGRALPDVPEPLSRFVAQCIEPDAAKRFARRPTWWRRSSPRRPWQAAPDQAAVGLPLMAATVVVLAWRRGPGRSTTSVSFIPPPLHDPVSVLIADFANSTGDARLRPDPRALFAARARGHGIRERLRPWRHASARRAAARCRRRNRRA
jgi:serine/threonine protein kinase